MATKWGQRWTGATLGPWGHQMWWGSQGGKRKERGWAKKHQGKVREVSKYVQVFCSLFFYDEKDVKAWRLVDCPCVLQGQGKAGQWRVYAEGACRGQQALTEVCWTTLSVLLGNFHSTAHAYRLCNAFLRKLFDIKHTKRQWRWILTYLPLKCCPPTAYAALDCCIKAWYI